MAEHFDVVVLGGGPGGYAAALYGAAAGLNIAMVEEARVGGARPPPGCDGTELTGDALILATGSLPRSIPGFDFDGERILSSDHVLQMDRVPGRTAIIGGGAIGCEFASYLADVGSEVTVLEALPSILPGV